MVIRKDREPENNGSLGAEFKLLPLLLFCIAFFALLSLISYSPEDVNSIYGGSYAVPGNWIGPFGAHFSWYMLLNFGLVAYIGVIVFLLRTLRLFLPSPGKFSRFFAGTMLLCSGLLLHHDRRNRLHRLECGL